MRAQDLRDDATPLKSGGRAGARSGAPAASASASRGETILLLPLFFIRLHRISSITFQPPSLLRRFFSTSVISRSFTCRFLSTHPEPSVTEHTRAPPPSPLTHNAHIFPPHRERFSSPHTLAPCTHSHISHSPFLAHHSPQTRLRGGAANSDGGGP